MGSEVPDVSEPLRSLLHGVPIASGLRIGTWRLLADNGPGTTQDRVSDTFEVLGGMDPPCPLDGATVRGRIAVFLGNADDPIADLDRVVFTLDGKKQSVEELAPYDLLGGTVYPRFLNPSRMKKGRHTVTATVDLADDDVKVLYKATFTVTR
jgi:hypothetical protein